MRRRELIALMGGMAALRPLAARAQQDDRVRRLGILSANPRDTAQIVAFFDELNRLGFIEGKNLSIDFRRFTRSGEELAGAAADLAKSGVEVIVCNGPRAIQVAQSTTQTIPILGLSDDMVSAGLVQSLARPGGNITGISILAPDGRTS